MTWGNVQLVDWQSPEIYNLAFQYHTQPLLDVFKALLLIHFHCAQPVWPMRITPTYFNPAETLEMVQLMQPLVCVQQVTQKKKDTQAHSYQLPRKWLHNCERFVSWVPFVLHIQINDNVSPFLPLKEWYFGIHSLSKLEYAYSFRGSARIWALGALWGHEDLIAQRPPVTAALSDFNGRMGGWIIWTVRDYGNKGQREKKTKKNDRKQGNM